MATDISLSTPSVQRRGWAARLLRHLGVRKPGAAARGRTAGAVNEVANVARKLIAEDRYLFVLLKDAAIEEAEAVPAWRALEEQMALVPYGVAPVLRDDGVLVSAEVSAFFLDRFAVTNQQYQRFVNSGGYDALEMWPREVWPGLMRFTDRTGQPGPSGWEHGRYPADQDEYPVTGVCWFEALAYARWVGKRLPTAAEWQKASGWPEQLSGGSCNRYPWGEVFDPARANLWASGLGRVVAVRTYPRGATPNGIYQMTGNVWEWLDEPLESIACRAGEAFESFRPLRRIVGGAFDTYLPSEATTHFVTGQPELDRRANIGFRCAVSADRLRPPPPL